MSMDIQHLYFSKNPKGKSKLGSKFIKNDKLKFSRRNFLIGSTALIGLSVVGAMPFNAFAEAVLDFPVGSGV